MLGSLIFILLIPLFISLGLLIKSCPILQNHSPVDLLLNSTWSPSEDEFGFFPFIISSGMVTFLSFLMAAPLCLLSAIYLTQYAKNRLVSLMQPVIDILAGIPSVVYGVWGILVIVPLISRFLSPLFNVQSSGYSILAGGIVLTVMTIPFILSILIEVFQGIPLELKEASFAVGATRWETIKYVIIRKGYSGVIAAFGLGISKAFGETIAVLMVVGNVPRIPEHLLSAGYPLPALIANNYGEMMSIPQYDAALMLAAFILFIIVFLFNCLARLVIIHSEVH
jgi:phosphate transport system permease protein